MGSHEAELTSTAAVAKRRMDSIVRPDSNMFGCEGVGVSSCYNRLNRP